MRYADSVFENMELKGEWWLPETPTHRVHGTLSGSDAEGFRLRLPEALEKGENAGQFPSPRDLHSHPIIHGRCPSGWVTLFDSSLGHKSTTFGSQGKFVETTYDSRLVTKGTTLVASHGELRFQRVRANFSVLSEWILAPPGNTNADLSSRRIAFDLGLPEDQILFDDTLFSVFLSFNMEWREVQSDSFRIHWGPEIVIDSKKGPLPWFVEDGICHLSIIHTLNQFLSTVTLEPCYPFGATGYTGQPGDDSDDDELAKVHLHWERQLERAQCDLRRFLFQWKSIRDNPEVVVAKWFRKYPSMGVPVSLFIDSLKKRNSYSPERFLNLAMTLEGLHRIRFPDSSILTPEHRERLNGIVSAVPICERQWLKQKLAFSHEPSLRNRLTQLTELFPESFVWLIGVDEQQREEQKKQCNKLIGAMAKSRNALAHGLREPGRSPGRRYIYFTMIMEWLMSMILMGEMGFDDEFVNERMKANWHVYQRREQVIEFLREELGSGKR